MSSETYNPQLEQQQQPPTTDNASDDVVSIDLPAPPGWSKKFTPKKGGTPRRNEVVFIAPTGEEIKNKKELGKYLKSHSGGPSLSEFDWGTGDTPRRSSRLRNKPEATETPESGQSRKKQKRSGSKAEAEQEEADNGESGENDAPTDKTELEKDVEMKDAEDAPAEKTIDKEKAPVEELADEEKAPFEKSADEEKAPVEKTEKAADEEKACLGKKDDEEKALEEKIAEEVGAPVEKTTDERGLDTFEKADETDQQGQDSNVAGLFDEKQIQPEEIKPEGEVEQGNAPVLEEAAGLGTTQLPVETAAPGKEEEQPVENKVELVIQQVETQVSLETVMQPEDNTAGAGDNHFNVALPENKNAVDEQSAGNNERPEKELAGDQPEAYNLTINDYTDVFEAAPTHNGLGNFETSDVREDIAKKMSSEDVATYTNNSTKENQEAVKHTENNSVIADNITREPSGAPPISF